MRPRLVSAGSNHPFHDYWHTLHHTITVRGACLVCNEGWLPLTLSSNPASSFSYRAKLWLLINSRILSPRRKSYDALGSTCLFTFRFLFAESLVIACLLAFGVKRQGVGGQEGPAAEMLVFLGTDSNITMVSTDATVVLGGLHNTLQRMS